MAAVYHSSLVVRDTLIDFFGDLSRARGEFLVYDDGFRSRSYTYFDVGRAAAAFAARLHAFGLRKGDKVLFWSENRPEWIVAFWGCLLRGIAVSGTPAHITQKAREAGLLLSVAGANVIRFAPPFIVARAQLDEAVQILDGVLATGAGK